MCQREYFHGLNDQKWAKITKRGIKSGLSRSNVQILLPSRQVKTFTELNYLRNTSHNTEESDVNVKTKWMTYKRYLYIKIHVRKKNTNHTKQTMQT